MVVGVLERRVALLTFMLESLHPISFAIENQFMVDA